jgi:hypothetical protein
MAEKDDKSTPRGLEDIEREVDKMENAEAGGEGAQPIVTQSDDDIEVVLAPEDDEGEPINLDKLEEVKEETLGGEEDDAKGDDTDDDIASYSEKVRRRIMRERGLRVAAENREEAERTARIQSQAENHASQLNSAEITLAMVEGNIKEKEALLKAAKDGGKIEDDIKLSGELGELRARKTEVERVRDHLKTAKPAQPNPLLHAWERENRWYGNTEFYAESATVRAISQQVAQKYPPNTKEHFEEVDKQLRQRMPNLVSRVKARLGQDAIRGQDTRGGNGKTQLEPRRQAPRLASPGGGFGRPSNSGSKQRIVITKTDVEAMRRVRLDPNNKTHVLEYAENKAALEK